MSHKAIQLNKCLLYTHHKMKTTYLECRLVICPVNSNENLCVKNGTEKGQEMDYLFHFSLVKLNAFQSIYCLLLFLSINVDQIMIFKLVVE